MICKCSVPVSGKHNRCLSCGWQLDPSWTCNDFTLAEFFGRLESALYPFAKKPTDIPAPFRNFRAHVEHRELAGRAIFDNAFLGRQNCAEGMEEATDGALYALLDTLQARRQGLGDADIDLALTAAQYFAKAYEALEHLHEKRLGAP